LMAGFCAHVLLFTVGLVNSQFTSEKQQRQSSES
jgi:hypothetical protein